MAKVEVTVAPLYVPYSVLLIQYWPAAAKISKGEYLPLIFQLSLETQVKRRRII